MQQKMQLVLAIALAAGCGGGSSTADDGGGLDAVLIGTWSVQITPPSADNQSQAVTFAADGTYTAVHYQTNSRTASSRAGCGERLTEVGAYVVGGGMMTITPDASRSELSLEGCADSSESGTSPFTGTPIFMASPMTVPYAIAGDTLTLLDMMFMRS